MENPQKHTMGQHFEKKLFHLHGKSYFCFFPDIILPWRFLQIIVKKLTIRMQIILVPRKFSQEAEAMVDHCVIFQLFYFFAVFLYTAYTEPRNTTGRGKRE